MVIKFFSLFHCCEEDTQWGSPIIWWMYTTISGIVGLINDRDDVTLCAHPTQEYTYTGKGCTGIYWKNFWAALEGLYNVYSGENNRGIMTNTSTPLPAITIRSLSLFISLIKIISKIISSSSISNTISRPKNCLTLQRLLRFWFRILFELYIYLTLICARE